jgi:DNA-binding NarL/FixJ family response regulator
VHLVEDHELIRAGLTCLLTRAGFTCGPLDGASAALVDVGAPSARDVLAQAHHLGLRTVAFARTMTPPRALLAAEAGAQVVLDSTATFTDADRALRGLVSDRFSSALASSVAELYMRRNALEPLTPREFEVLERLARNEAPGVIARELGISALTVRNHIANAQSKLQAKSRRELLEHARYLGLLDDRA